MSKKRPAEAPLKDIIATEFEPKHIRSSSDQDQTVSTYNFLYMLGTKESSNSRSLYLTATFTIIVLL